MKDDGVERLIEASASTPAEAAAATFFYRRGDAADVRAALSMADSLESSLDKLNMVIADRRDLALNHRGLVGRRVVWRPTDPTATGPERRYGVVTKALVKFDTGGEWGVAEQDDVRLVVALGDTDGPRGDKP